MTIKDLLGKSGSELVAMSDEELNSILGPYFKFVRPESGALKRKNINCISTNGPIKASPNSPKSRKINLNKDAYTEIEKMLRAKAQQLGIIIPS